MEIIISKYFDNNIINYDIYINALHSGEFSNSQHMLGIRKYDNLDYELGIMLEKKGDPKKARKYFQSAYQKEEIGDLTKEMMIDKSEEMKKANSKWISNPAKPVK
jgi:hypothetical protein